MSKKDKKVTLKKSLALEALLSGANANEAAAAAGVVRNTLYKWQRDPDFIDALNQAKSEAMDRLGRSLSALGEKAVMTLDAAMDDPDAGPAVKIRAADIVLNRALSIQDAAEFEKRLSDLEKQLNIRS